MTAAAVQNVLDRLPSAKSAGPGKWMALCPVHEADGNGHKASLSVAQGDDGKVLLNCKAGCATEAVVKALGLTMADLFSDRPKAPTAYRPVRPGPHTAKPARVYALPCLAAKHLAKATGGELAGWWPYFNADDGEALTVLRFNLPDGGKTYRPLRRDGDDWAIGDPAGPLPLYRLTKLKGAARPYICEGEKCADAAAGIGLVATTSAHGAEAARKTDWTPLAGRDVVILPDNDKGGERYARDVATILTRLDPPARVHVVRLPGLPEGGDICDWLSADGPMDAHDNDEIKGAIEALAETVTPWTPGPADTKAAAPDAEDSRAVLVNLADVTPQPVRWLWPGRIPLGKVTLLCSDPGLGKSLVTLDVAARKSRGTAWPDAPGEPTAPGDTILLNAEDDVPDTVVPRLIAAGADVTRIVMLQGVEYAQGGKGYFNLAHDLPALEDAIQRTPDVRLVVLDPISAYLGGTDSHKNAEMRGLLAPLADLAARYGVAILAVTHLNKAGAGRAMYRAMGSLAFIAMARAGWLVVADAADPKRRLMLPLKSNLAEEPAGLAYRLVPVMLDGIGPVARVEWEPGPVNVLADDALAAAAVDPEERTARESAAEWLKTILANGPMKTADLKQEARDAEIVWRTLRRAQKAAGVKTRKQGFGAEGAWYWFLPDHAPEDVQYKDLDTLAEIGKTV